MKQYVDDLEARARARFVSWDARLWHEIVDGPAAALAGGLDGTVGLGGRPVLESYLRLACEGVGLGYLFPRASGRDGFMNLAFFELAPRLLPAVPPPRQPETLAGRWNLGENLETAAPWLRRIFLRVFRGLDGLGDLPARVAEVERQALAPPERKLGRSPRAVRVWLGAEDRRFLPGALHFHAPTVVCVPDRARPDATQGIWLAETPLALGPMGCGEHVEPSVAKPPAAPGLTPAHATAANDWRVAATLVTSQYVVGWMG